MKPFDLREHLQPLSDAMVCWRRDFHKYAESGWFEFRTASIVAEELDQLGYQLQLGQHVFDAHERMGLPTKAQLLEQLERAKQQGAISRWLPYFAEGFTGIVATLDSGRPGPTLGFRFDMDALDLDETDDLKHRPNHDAFASVNPHMMHACGHDGHTAIGLGLAHLLKQLQSHWSGRVKIIFQPAEEGTRGAKSMANAGVVDDIDYFTAIHLGTGVPPQTLVCGCNAFMATSKLDITFHGCAAHAGGKPEEGRNALLAAAQATLALHAINRHSEGASRVNVGVLQAGTGRNVIAPHAYLKLETRGQTNSINDYLKTQAEQIIQGIATMYGVESSIEQVGAAQSSQCSPQWIAFIHKQAQQTGCFKHIENQTDQSAGSEDATYFMQRVKENGGLASYAIFGTQLSAGHHNEYFDFDESVMTSALQTLAGLVLNIQQFTSDESYL